MVKTKEQVRREIEQTRVRLGDTVDALFYRADVPGRAKESLKESRERAVEFSREHPAYLLAGLAALVAAAGLATWAGWRQ